MKLLDIFFNKLPPAIRTKTVLYSMADQLKLTAWAMGGINYLISDANKLESLIFIIPGWLFFQYLAIYLLAKIDIGEQK